MGAKQSRLYLISNATPFTLLLDGETQINQNSEHPVQGTNFQLNLSEWKEPPLVLPPTDRTQDTATTLAASLETLATGESKISIRMRENPFELDFNKPSCFFRVLTYNVHLFKGSTAPVGAVITSVAGKSLSLGLSGAIQNGLDRVLYDDTHRSQELIKCLLDSDAHVIGLQEVWASDMVSSISKGVSSKYPYSWAPEEDFFDLKVSSGLLLLSQFPIVSHHCTKYKNLHGDCSWANKGVASATISVPFKGSLYPVQFSITHAGTDVGGPTLPNMKQLADSVKDTLYPAVLLGDFNVKQSDYEQMNQILEATGCKDAYRQVHPELGNDANTVDISANQLDQFFTAIPGSLQTGANRIDYIYHKPGNIFHLVPRAARVIRDWKYDSVKMGVKGMDVSDHYPVLCDFELKDLNDKPLPTKEKKSKKKRADKKMA